MGRGTRSISRGQGSHALTKSVSRLTFDEDIELLNRSNSFSFSLNDQVVPQPFSSLIYETESRDWAVTGFLSKLFKDRKGYKRFADSGTPVHRYVAARKLGRNLKKGDVVHHI